MRIDLDDYRDPGVLVMAGRERGLRSRAHAQLDRADRTAGHVEVHVPTDFFSVNASFFLGMFGPSITYLGEEQFRAKYRFTGKNIQKTIEDGIREALRTLSPL